MRAAEEGRRQSITRQTDISVIVEEAGNGSSSQQPIEENDEEMSDADSEGEDDEDEDRTEIPQEPAQEAAAAEDHLSEIARRREHSINRRIIDAWERGVSLPPEIEQYLKEQSERGTLSSSSMDFRGILSRPANGYVQLNNPTTNSTTPTTAVPRAAA